MKDRAPTAHRNAMDHLQRLFDAYAENDLSPQDRQDLCAWLQESEAHVDRFVRDTFLHWQLFDVIRQQDLHDDVMATAPPALDAKAVVAMVMSSPELGVSAPRSRRRAWLGLAASLAIAGSVAWGVAANWPRTVAQLTKASPTAAWDAAADAPRAGGLLREGDWLRLSSGRATVTLVSGSQLIIEGPASVRVDGENQLWIESGRIGVDVPPQATGLVVESEMARFVDLGTAFTIDMDPAAGCEIYVFSGMVEMTPDGDGGAPVRISMGSAISFDAASGDVASLPYDDAQQMEL